MVRELAPHVEDIRQACADLGIRYNRMYTRRGLKFDRYKLYMCEQAEQHVAAMQARFPEAQVEVTLACGWTNTPDNLVLYFVE